MRKNFIFILIIFTLISCQNEREKNYLKTRDDLVLKIEPFETKSKTFDYLQNNDSLEYFVFAGKIKTNRIKDFTGLNPYSTYLQLNEKITNHQDLLRFITDRDYYVLIYADKNTPKEYLKSMESEILKKGIDKNKIFYYFENKEENIFGYNHSY
ncbi:hypothetical protein [uncultured Tenacibaculum sp.]|uniref:hypothetical protein n=1 Tax=uncultured Tenacibaculum sp. TaxID=174713 RepID=UPI0026139375|nr:hypothetical protein [uncultured Tenacibaculum sp.]